MQIIFVHTDDNPYLSSEIVLVRFGKESAIVASYSRHGFCDREWMGGQYTDEQVMLTAKKAGIRQVVWCRYRTIDGKVVEPCSDKMTLRLREFVTDEKVKRAYEFDRHLKIMIESQRYADAETLCRTYGLDFKYYMGLYSKHSPTL